MKIRALSAIFGICLLTSLPVSGQEEAEHKSSSIDASCFVIKELTIDATAGSMTIITTWHNPSKTVYLCQHVDIQSRFFFENDKRERVNEYSMVSWDNYFDIGQMVHLHPGIEISQKCVFPISVRRDEMGKVFVLARLGTSGSVHLDCGETYTVQQMAWTRCDSIDAIITFPCDEKGGECRVSGPVYRDKYGEWLPRTVGTDFSFKVPSVAELGKDVDITPWPGKEPDSGFGVLNYK